MVFFLIGNIIPFFRHNYFWNLVKAQAPLGSYGRNTLILFSFVEQQSGFAFFGACDFGCAHFLFWRKKMKKDFLDAADIRMEVLYEKKYSEKFNLEPKKPDAALKALLYANPFLKAQSKEEREDYINLALMISQIAASKGAKIEVLLFEDVESISIVISALSFSFAGVEIGKLIRACSSSSIMEINSHPDDSSKCCLCFDYMFSVDNKLLPLMRKQLLNLDHDPEARF